MKVGVIGLGDIAQKAYLPVLTTRPGVELHLQTRTPATLRRIGDAHHVPAGQRHTGLDALIAQGLDAAFVHAPTAAHPEIVTRLLEAGVPTYVDKPLAYELDESRALVELAEARGVGLAVGFNRRYAPGYAQCADHPRDLIIMQKNRIGLPEDPRTLVLDDFIHVVDTLRFLLPGEADHIDVRAVVREGLMHQVVLQLSGDGFTALGVMNRLSGSTEEILEVSGQDTKRQVVNLAEVIDHRGQPTVQPARRLGAGRPPARHRTGRGRLPGSRRRYRVPSARDALLTHELCERVVRSALEQAS